MWSLVAVFTSTASDDWQVIHIAVAFFTEESHFTCLDTFGYATVSSTGSLTASVFDAHLGLAFGLGVNIDVTEHDFPASGS